MLTAIYLTKRTASQTVNTQSPLQLLSAAFPLIKLGDSLRKRVFGCECYVHLYPNQTNKLSPRALVYLWDIQIHKKDISTTTLLDGEF